MLAVVLVGGEGTRLRPLTYTTPKPLLPICNQPFLERQLTWLARSGVDEVVLSMGYLPDAFHERFPDDRYGDVRIRYAVEPVPLGTGGAIRFAADDVDETFIVCNGDVLTDLDLDDLMKLHDDSGAEATIALTRVDDPSRFGVVPTDDTGRVLAFVEKPPPERAPSHWINAGSYVLEPSMLDRIPKGVTASVEREIFPRTLQAGGVLYALRSEAFWLDIGVPRQFLDANRDVLDGRLGTPPVAGVVEREPGVWMPAEADAMIDEGARIEPPVLIGEGARVAAGATVSHSVIGPRARVDTGAHLSRSVLLEGACVEPRAVAIDSVVGTGARLGEGATLTEMSVVGAGAVIAAGTAMAGARVDPPGLDETDAS